MTSSPAPKYTAQYMRQLPLFDRSVSFVSWAYNEEELIEGFLHRANDLLKHSVADYEIVVVDDGSTDRTNEIIRRVMRDMPRLRLVENKVNMNVGYSSRVAVQSATKEYVVWQVVDWGHDIAYFRLFLEFLRTHDIVAGVRRGPVQCGFWPAKPLFALCELFGGRHLSRRSDTVSKALVSVINYVLIRALYRVPLSDYQNVVFYPTKLVQSLPMESNSAFINPELLIRAYWTGARIAEVPVAHIARDKGEAKGTRLPAIWAAVKDVFSYWFRWTVLGQLNKLRRGSVTRLKPWEWEF